MASLLLMSSSSSRKGYSTGRNSKTSETDAIDAESAYGSDVSSNSNRTLKKEDFDIEEPTNKTEMWYEWLKYRIRHYMILEALFFIILILLLFNSYHISSQNEKLISNFQSRFDSIEKQIKEIHICKKEAKEPNSRKFEPTETILKVEELTTSQPMETIPSIFSNQQNPLTSSSNYSQLVINAASFELGATIVTENSSIPVSADDGFFSSIEENYVLFDREEIPPNKAWCSNEKEPVLTVWLSKFIKPTAVSYQHTKWNGTVPDGAPKIYDLKACLDSKCKELMPLVSNCQYTSSVKKQEQICHIPSISNLPPINKVQFHFHKNHGNATKTCAYLVRVYGNESKNRQEDKIKMIKDAKTCARIKWYFHNIPILYDQVEENCKSLYSMNCCDECPECCQECNIKTDFFIPFLKVLIIVFGVFFLVIGFVWCSFFSMEKLMPLE